MNDDLSPEERRARHRAEWEARLMPIMTAEWQSAAAIAAALGAKVTSVHERLNDAVKKGLIERRIVTNRQPAPPSRKRRRQRHVRKLEAQYRLPAVNA
jgi:DNA-binding MarR family transcriptional regulator